MGSSQLRTTGRMFFTRIGVRKTVPSRIERIVAFGLFHISVSSGYSSMRCAFGVIVAHLTATPSRFVASAASTVT